MNHSQAVIARRIVVDQINILQEEIQDRKRFAAEFWNRAIPGTNEGRIYFDCMNVERDCLRTAKRELAALAALSKLLGYVAVAENALAGWMRDTEIDFDEVLTDEDYNGAVTCFDDNGIGYPAGWDRIEGGYENYHEAR